MGRGIAVSSSPAASSSRCQHAGSRQSASSRNSLYDSARRAPMASAGAARSRLPASSGARSASRASARRCAASGGCAVSVSRLLRCGSRCRSHHHAHRQLCEPPPRITPRSGDTSPKSRPQASATCSWSTRRLLVGSNSIQPYGGANTATQACEASAPSTPVPMPGRWRSRAQVAADVARGQSGAAQAGDHHVREVLADAAALARTPPAAAWRSRSRRARSANSRVHLGHQRGRRPAARWRRRGRQSRANSLNSA